MKLEYLPSGDAYCPLLRLFDYQPGEVDRLREACGALASGQIREFALHAQPWVEVVGGVEFTWRASAKDDGVRLPANALEFVLEYSDEAWREVEDKLLPFAQGSTGFNWLTNEGDVEVLISLDGEW
jgi:hypothetical protein